VHVFVVQVDQIAKRANVARRAWLGRSVAVDVALHFKRPFFAVLAPSERLGHITGRGGPGRASFPMPIE
jgi:hypothetical protein